MKVKIMHANEEQAAALRKFAAKHGRYWKRKLIDKWLDGTDGNEPDGHLLRQVRNQLGPSWLINSKEIF